MGSILINSSAILMVSSERSSSDLLEYTLFQIQKVFLIYENKFLIEKLFFWFSVAVAFKMLPKISDFIK